MNALKNKRIFVAIIAVCAALMLMVLFVPLKDVSAEAVSETIETSPWYGDYEGDFDVYGNNVHIKVDPRRARPFSDVVFSFSAQDSVVVSVRLEFNKYDGTSKIKLLAFGDVKSKSYLYNSGVPIKDLAEVKVMFFFNYYSSLKNIFFVFR